MFDNDYSHKIRYDIARAYSKVVRSLNVKRATRSCGGHNSGHDKRRDISTAQLQLRPVIGRKSRPIQADVENREKKKKTKREKSKRYLRRFSNVSFTGRNAVLVDVIDVRFKIKSVATRAAPSPHQRIHLKASFATKNPNVCARACVCIITDTNGRTRKTVFYVIIIIIIINYRYYDIRHAR